MVGRVLNVVAAKDGVRDMAGDAHGLCLSNAAIREVANGGTRQAALSRTLTSLKCSRKSLPVPISVFEF